MMAFYYTIPFNNIRDTDYVSNSLENLIKTIKNEVRILILFTYGLILEKIAQMSKKENIANGYVFIAASNFALGAQNTKSYHNWLTLTIFMPQFNIVNSDADLDDPLFEGITNCTKIPIKKGFVSSAGDSFLSFFSLSYSF